MKSAIDWTNEEIAAYFDAIPNLTLATLAGMTGKSVEELKTILMGGNKNES
jgi:hypothetical protein